MKTKKKILNGNTGLLIKTIFNPVLLVSFVVILQSCSSSDPYPQDWGAVYDNDKKGDSVISGVYYCMGDCSQSNLSKYLLTDLIELPGLSEEDYSRYNIIIKLENKDKLVIILRRGTDTTYKTVFPDNNLDFSFTDDGLELKGRELKKSGDDISISTQSANIYLMKGENGSLIAMGKSQALGLMFFLPVYASKTVWFRFWGY